MSYERPKYFCGHLLTDVDLTQEQRYFREKTSCIIGHSMATVLCAAYG